MVLFSSFFNIFNSILKEKEKKNYIYIYAFMIRIY